MKKITFILILFLVVLSSGIGIVSAETLTGTPGGSTYAQTNITVAHFGTQTNALSMIAVNSVESAIGTVALVKFDETSPATFTGPIKSGNSSPFIAKIGSQVIVTGTFGYQRSFDGLGVEQLGYQWMTFNDDWNVTGQSGDKDLALTFPQGLPDGILIYGWNTGAYPAVDGDMWFGYSANRQMTGQYLRTVSESTYAGYSLSSPSGIGITGTITKNVGGITYTNLAGIYKAGTGVAITTQSVMTSTDLNVSTILYPSGIYVGIKSPLGVWYNSSTLFSGGGTTPTPTPTPTPTVTLLPGQFWTTFAAQDATTGGLIPGAEIDIYSRFTGTWNNATTSTGERTIATSSDNYYDVNGNASGYSSGSLTNVMAYNNAYYLVNLFPTTGLPSVPGQVNLFVSVTERETGLPISGASVSVATPGSWTVQGETDNKGIEIFSTSNSSVKYITVSKTGYKAETRTITTPASGNYNAVLQMSRIVVTTVPTGYIPPGGVTPVTTMDSRSTTEKDTDMMNMIRDSGPQLIQLAIIVTMISLLGLITKGFGK